MNLTEAIQNWDQKSKVDIEGVYHQFAETSELTGLLISLLEDGKCQKGASWLLKYHLKQGQQLSAEEQLSLLQKLDALKDWETQLHILQIFPFLVIPSDLKLSVETFLRTTLTSTNKFVRAWSYNGFYLLAAQFPEYRAEAKQFLDMAIRDEAASVKARIRNILKNSTF